VDAREEVATIMTETRPMIRVRIAHDKTSKGWRCSETTVEISGVSDDTMAQVWMYETLENVMAELHTLGGAEETRRNAWEGSS